MEDSNVITTSASEINQRQQDLVGDFSNHVALVVGLGGIGNWIAVDLALLGVGTLILYDDDKIENSNLNRTLFKLSQVGEYKTKAVKQLISERRKNIIVVTNEERFKAEYIHKYKGIDFMFDCSDPTRLKNDLSEFSKTTPKVNTKSKSLSTLENQEDPVLSKYAKLGYDGFHATMCLNDFSTGQWGEDSSYTVTPSFFGTPQIVSALAIIELVIKMKPISKTINMNVKKMVSQIEDNSN
ncbi:MAG: ThiF family adenylyltransferase [Ignavibacteria bacterium]|nr:ThiF family adenylyltransferase [Ignavibacteria bacterium]